MAKKSVAKKPVKKVAKKSAKKAVKSSTDKSVESVVVATQHDAKNRLVQLTQTGDKFSVSKEATGYASDHDSQEDAEKAFSFQINCTQN